MNGYNMNITTRAFSTIQVLVQRAVVTIRLNRPEAGNTINDTLISELLEVLDSVEQDAGTVVIVLEGSQEYFCTGMDFQSFSDDPGSLFADADKCYELLQRFSLSSKIIVSKVEGKVNAGGVGLVAASDIVIAGEQASFGLSEALFGLLPACVLPFLIRRVGYQKAQWMALTTQPIPAEKAAQIGLVDELSAHPADALRRSLLRLTKLNPGTVGDLKEYMSRLWIIREETRKLATDKLASLMASEKVQSNIRNFVQNKQLPWDR
jgi:polyketide biosynthesis enoyl-CoA hydratase PksH